MWSRDRRQSAHDLFGHRPTGRVSAYAAYLLLTTPVISTFPPPWQKSPLMSVAVRVSPGGKAIPGSYVVHAEPDMEPDMISPKVFPLSVTHPCAHNSVKTKNPCSADGVVYTVTEPPSATAILLLVTIPLSPPLASFCASAGE